MDLPFLNPWLLTGGVAVAGPVLIHLLNRQKVRTIEWGAMMLLRRVVKVRSREIRLEDILLMLLRCLIIALIVLAAARPVTKRSGIVKSPDVAVVVAIDASMSMKHAPGVRSRFDLAKDRAREIFATVPPGTPATLVLLGQQPRVLLSGVGYDAQAFEQALAGAQPLAEPLNLERCLPDLDAMLRELSAPSRELYLVTDAQKMSWEGLSAPARLALAQLQNSGRTLIVPLAGGGDRNLAVTRLEIAAGLPRVGSLVRYEAEVANFSPDTQDAGEIALEVDGETIDRRHVGSLKSGERKRVPIYATLRRDGIARVAARLGDDPLLDDNARYAAVHVRQSVRVLCVLGEAVSQGQAPGGAVVTALAPGRLTRTDSPVEVETTSWLALPATRLADYDVVTLIDIPDVGAQLAADLKAFVAAGGGLMIFPGGGSRVEAWNEHLAHGSSPLLPAELLQSPPRIGEGVAIDWQPSDHPVLRPLRALPADLLAETRLFRLLGARPSPQGHAILNTAAGEPVLLEQAFGRGRVLLFTGSAERDWSNLAVNPAFPLMLQHAVTYLTAQPYERPLELPEALVLPVSAGAATIAAPDAPARPATIETRNGQPVLVETLHRPGFHTITTGETSVTVAANAPVGESDVTVLSPDQLRTATEDTAAEVVSPGETIAAAAAISRRGHELAPLLLIAAAVLFLVEGLLARWYTGRGVKRRAA